MTTASTGGEAASQRRTKLKDKMCLYVLFFCMLSGKQSQWHEGARQIGRFPSSV